MAPSTAGIVWARPFDKRTNRLKINTVTADGFTTVFAAFDLHLFW